MLGTGRRPWTPGDGRSPSAIFFQKEKSFFPASREAGGQETIPHSGKHAHSGGQLLRGTSGWEGNAAASVCAAGRSGACAYSPCCSPSHPSLCASRWGGGLGAGEGIWGVGRGRGQQLAVRGWPAVLVGGGSWATVGARHPCWVEREGWNHCRTFPCPPTSFLGQWWEHAPAQQPQLGDVWRARSPLKPRSPQSAQALASLLGFQAWAPPPPRPALAAGGPVDPSTTPAQSLRESWVQPGRGLPPSKASSSCSSPCSHAHGSLCSSQPVLTHVLWASFKSRPWWKEHTQSFSFSLFFLFIFFLFCLAFSFSSVTHSCLTLCDLMDWGPCWTHQASLSITNSQSLLKLMSIESVMPSNHLILSRPFLLPPPIFPSIRVFSNESTLRIRWPKYWSFSFSISPSNEHPRLISFRMDWLDLLAVQGTLDSLLQHHSSKASILWHSAFFIVQISYPYITTGKKQ